MSELQLIHEAPRPSSVEIVLDLPMPTSTNRLYGRGRGPVAYVHRSDEYVSWMEEADMAVMADRAYPKRTIAGPFEVVIMLSRKHRGDGDNRIKAALDWLQSREIVRNDVDCRRGSWAWVDPGQAPRGCRVILTEA
jgi:Holliday junction resolvase RusA-like endonuclease